MDAKGAADGDSASAVLRSADIRVDGCRVRYWEAGSGDPILLLHGFPQDHNCWRKQVAVLARGHRVVAPDWFGFGESERGFHAPPDYEREVARVGELGARLCGPRYNLFCHDYGGYLGLGHTLSSPDSVRRLAILNSRAHGNFRDGFQRFSRVQGALSHSAIGRSLARLLPLSALYRRALAPYVQNGSFDARQLNAYLAWLHSSEGKRWYFHFFAHYQVEAPPRLAAGLAQIRCPTAIIWGEHDAYIPRSTAKELAATIPKATLTMLRGAHHYVTEERPQEVNDALLALLAIPTP